MMNRFKIASVAGAALLCATLAACDSEQATTAPAPKVAEIAEATQSLQALVDTGQLPGAILIVEQKGKRLADITVGYQDVDKKTPLDKESVFRLYSMSKPITSVAIMMLVDRGLVRLDDPASKFLPALADMRVYESGTVDDMVTVPAERPITIHDLLTHTSGIPYHFTGNTPVHQYYRKHGVMRDTPVGRTPEDGEPAHSLSELVDRIGAAPLLYQPGQKFEYSYSTTVLGAVVEAASGQPLDVFLKENIFDPLGMTHTGFFIEDDALSHFVTGYAATEGGITAIEQPETSDYRDHKRLLDGGGALASTADDYLKFATMLANKGEYQGKRLLSSALVEKMFMPQTRIEGWGPHAIKFGYGFAIGDAETAAAGLQPDGTVSWSGSGNTYFFVNPDTGLVAELMTHVIVGGKEQGRTVVFRSLVNKLAMELAAP
ncbi:MAG: class A beta-lactamase-related serine hydrolase [Alphaproteobacteria bacterium]|nr:MAG: class A beta-lactamase-related serine hydrolase [Alphaproteobacteria bacterium]